MTEHKSIRNTLWLMFKYGLVGGVNTAVSVAIMILLAWMGFHYAIYTGIAYVIGICVSFTLNRQFTFQVKDRSRSRFVKFITINLINLAFIQLLQFILIDQVLITEWIGVGIGMIVYTLLGFFMTKRFVFRKREFT